MGDIRRLVQGLRPPALDELGLVGALRQRAAQYGVGGNLAAVATGVGDGPLLSVTVEAPDTVPPLPAAVEVAVYRIVEEALTNVVNHARAGRCVVRLAVEDGVRLTIADDGIGIAPGQGSGMGLLSMRERAAELGGACEVGAAAGGGSRVEVRLPLPAAGA